MGRKAKRYIVVFLAAAICFCGFAFTALADTTQNFQYGKIQRTFTGTTGGYGAGYGADATGNGAERETDSVTQIMLSFDLKGGSGLSNNNVDKGTKVSELKVPVRKGYDFAGWIVNGKKVPDSYTMNTDTFLTATWEKAESSSSSRESAVGDNEEDSSDTITSSESEDALVNSAVSSAPASSAAASSQAASSDGHYSYLFYLGIALVALGLGGIVMLICRQIHNHRGGKGGPGASSGGKQDGAEFTDISSSSDGKKHR